MSTSPLQTWALMNGVRSGSRVRGNSDDVLMDWLSTLTSPSAETPSTVTSATPPKVIAPEYIHSSSSQSSQQPTPTPTTKPNTNFYEGGLGAPSWVTGASSTGIGALGQLAGLPGPVTSVVSKLAGAALGQEGINGHTMANGGVDVGASLLGLGLPNLALKLGSKIFGYEYDPANFIGELTNSPGLMSPRTLNLKAFERGSGDAFTGLNQPTLAEITRQEERNAAEHAARNKRDAAAAEQDAQMQARAAAEASRVSALNQLAAQAAANQEAINRSSAAPVNGTTSQSGGNTGRFGSAVGPGSEQINRSSSGQVSANNYSSNGSVANSGGTYGGTGNAF